MRILFVCLLVSAIISGSVAYGGTLTFIANKGISVDNLSRKDIRNIFKGKMVRWPNNSPIKPAVLKSSSEIEETFLENFVNFTAAQWNSYWKKMIFTGRGMPPETFKSIDDMIRFVANTPGAIGYVDVETIPENIRTVNIK